MLLLKRALSYLLVLIVATGCATLEVENKNDYVDYDQSNVVKIEESIQGLDINSFVAKDVDKDDVIALAPTELDARYERDPRDLGVRYIIEDNLISQLVKDYKVAERDQSLMYYLERETGKNYNKYTEKYEGKESEVNEKAKSPEATTITNNFYGDVSGIDAISEAKTEDKETEFTVTTDFVAADKLLTYRVLECGVFFKQPEINPMNNLSIENVDKVDRYARTRLHCRLEDAKTGIILNAGIVEHETVDRVKRSDLTSLENINYTFYQHELPTIKSEDQKIGEIVTDKTPATTFVSPAATGAAPKPAMVALVGLLAMFLLGG